ncbi:uncharacterized protein ZBAI_00297 [Zygosaccharomyces bailii ISA1307]|nr:uncharacterized protein ZBAI_00297 [Zygosaccharomyces bailii ISA1307]
MQAALKNWSSCPQLLSLPSADSHIKCIHIYDFDNTLYLSPQPNRQLYTQELLASLYGGTILGGRDWWSEPRFLEKSFAEMLETPKGSSREEFWNEEMLSLAKASFKDKDTVSIILTGRKEELFAKLFEETLQACEVLYFNAVCLKRAGVGQNTMDYKSAVIGDLIDQYEGSLEEITLYDDRISQVNKLSKFLQTLGGSYQRIVVPVVPRYRMLDGAEECRLVLQLVDANSVQWTPRQSGYFLSVQSHRNLLSWTFNFFQKKYSWNTLPQYPMYIPCCELGKTPPPEEIAQVWTNRASCDVDKCVKQFQAQDHSCEIQFIISELGFCNRSHGGLAIFFKARPSNKSRYLWNDFSQFIVIGLRYDSSDDPIFLQRVLEGKEQSIHWVKLRKSLKVKTYFGHYARLTRV